MTWFREAFVFDSRSIAISRILLGLVLLVDLVLRLGDLEAFYTEQGIMPRAFLLRHYWSEPMISVHTWGGTSTWIVVVFGVHMVAAVAFIAGYKTFWANLVVWVLLISLGNRNPAIMNGGDGILRLLLFWFLWIPAGRAWSADAGGAGVPARVLTVGTVGVVVQLLCMYSTTVALKTGESWTSNYTAVRLSLSSHEMATGIGLWLSRQGELAWLTRAAVFVEMWAPLMLLVTWRGGGVRVVGAAILGAFHVGMLLTLYTGLFQVVCFSALFVFVPSRVYQYLVRGRAGGATTSCTFSKNRVTCLTSWASGGVCLVFVVVYCLGNVFPGSYAVQLRAGAPYLANLCRLAQGWTMYAPDVPKKESKIYVLGHLQNGSVVGLESGSVNFRWRKLHSNLQGSRYKRVVPGFVRYTIAKNNSRALTPGGKLVACDFYMVSRDLRQEGPWTHRRFWKYRA